MSRTISLASAIRFLFCLAVVCVFEVALAQPGFDRGGGRGGNYGSATDSLAPEDVPEEMGAASIPDREAFEKLSYQGPMRGDAYLTDLEFVKFIVTNAGTDEAKIYWMDTNVTQKHPDFARRIGVNIGRGGRGGGGGGSNGTMRGALTYLPRLKSPNGTAGLYIFDFQPNDRFPIEMLKSAQDLIFDTMPFAEGKTAYHAFQPTEYTRQKEAFAAAGIVVHLDQEIYGDLGFLPLNVAESFGRLRVMENETHPSPRDIVICKTLPNQMPRVAGVISEVRQTPLSHVNLRAIQDKVPNAFVINALRSPAISSLIGKYVKYEVTSQGYKLREATKQEVDNYFASLRPTKSQVPKRNLANKEIRPLSDVNFDDFTSFGVKAANLATMQQFGLPEDTVPDGVAVPFYFYDEFMKHNGFYALVRKTLAGEQFQNSREVQQRELKKVRALIKKGRMPTWMMAALTNAQKSFAEGTSLRCRSSTNNEDLPGYSGAGLYDSYTHHLEEGHLSKSIKQVFASLWNFRAFEERDFYRIDHFQTAMGVLIHPNFKKELANGVAVTDDILYETYGNYYLNSQVGEDLVTNPDAESSPEEVLLSWFERKGHSVVRQADSQVNDGKPLIGDQHLDELREYLKVIHNRFSKLYRRDKNDITFAMEIEFKITNKNKLAIKQARPWVF